MVAVKKSESEQHPSQRRRAFAVGFGDLGEGMVLPNLSLDDG